MQNVLKVYGIHYLLFIDNVLFIIQIFGSKRHKYVGKDSGLTSLLERFNCTMRQRISRQKAVKSYWGPASILYIIIMLILFNLIHHYFVQDYPFIIY